MDSHYIYGSAHLVDLSGKNTLDENLVFHGKEYPAGTRVKSDVNLNWYDIGYQYNILFDKERTNLRMAPTVAFTLWDFSAELESNSGRNSRGYTKGTPRVGLELEWLPAKRFSVSGRAIASLPFNNMPHVNINFLNELIPKTCKRNNLSTCDFLKYSPDTTKQRVIDKMDYFLWYVDIQVCIESSQNLTFTT